MFTGIVEETGRILKHERKGQSNRLVVEARKVLRETQLGDSIAVNGVCLTVTQLTGSSFAVDIMPETYAKSTLSLVKSGHLVNLERAVTLSTRLGGHLVSGHVDGLGKLIALQKEENAIILQIATSPSILQYVVSKGSITVEGISLTVVEAGEESFTVSLIPHTFQETNLQGKRIGDFVNLEVDIIARYLEKLLRRDAGELREKKGLSLEYLHKLGF